MSAPTLTTARLTLRPLRYEDFPAYAAFLATDRAWGMGGPHGIRTAWEYFCNDTAQWTLLGMGGLMIETQDGTVIGQSAVCHGPIFPEPELGWFLYAGHEGQGFATEAAAAMRDWAFGPRGLTALVSYIERANAPSIRVAERLGGVIDPHAPTPFDEPDVVYRYHPGGRA